MEATNMMRKLMVAASLVAAAACGTVQAVDDEGGDVPVDEDSGSDAGSGSGSGSASADAGVVACMRATDCGANMACDLDSHECVSGMLSIEPSADFVIEPYRWWTPSSDPFLRGTFQGPAGAVIQVRAGSAAGIVATIAGNAWSVKLPSGSIAAADTDVTVMMTDPSGGLFELTQKMVHDAAGPAIGLVSSKVKDERGDQIDFSTGEPVHTHAGADVDLAGAGCPTVYKYAYLMDATVPYGTATTKNPLAWRFTISDTRLDPTTHQFRVRSEAGETLIQWTALPAPDSAGIHTVELTRNGGAFPIATLGDRAGKHYVDVRARDWNDTETVKTWCWTHWPLEVPVALGSFQNDQLSYVSLPNDSAFSWMLNPGGKARVLSQRIVQYAAEPTTFEWSATASNVTYTKQTLIDHVVDIQPASFFCQAGTTDPRCKTNWKPSGALAGLQSANGLATPKMTMFVYDETSGQVIAASDQLHAYVTLPARTTLAPHAYRLVVEIESMPQLQPVSWSAYGADVFGEHLLSGLMYTGSAPVEVGVSCMNLAQSAWGPHCSQLGTWYRVSALDHATIAFSLTASIKQSGLAPAHLPASALAAQFSWDSGDDDLPGPY